MNLFPLVLFAGASILLVVSLSSMYATNVTCWKGKGHISPWAAYVCIAAIVVAAAGFLLTL
ncbi:hypothetical protein [Brachybacterium alimentarium]|uniref:hypothetical protein n=1 Tax=Brachybacterium alimentarium TaxID=47845 RepID=UPI003FD53668